MTTRCLMGVFAAWPSPAGAAAQAAAATKMASPSAVQIERASLAAGSTAAGYTTTRDQDEPCALASLLSGVCEPRDYVPESARVPAIHLAHLDYRPALRP